MGEPVRLDFSAPAAIIVGDMLRALLILAAATIVIAAFLAGYGPPSGGEPSVSLAADQPAGAGTKPGSLAPPKITPDAAIPRLVASRLAPVEEQLSQTVARKVRDVTPAGVTAAPAAHAPLTRVEPPQAPEAPPQARVERLFNPVVTKAGAIKTRGVEIRLAGIDAPDFDARCGEGAAAWPCGREARAALRRFIRGRAIECELPPGVEAVPDPAACEVAGESLSEWLVAQGWAKRRGDGYAALETQARERQLGLWGGGRPGGYEDVAASSP